jgi:hypothetical protein
MIIQPVVETEEIKNFENYNLEEAYLFFFRTMLCFITKKPNNNYGFFNLFDNAINRKSIVTVLS